MQSQSLRCPTGFTADKYWGTVPFFCFFVVTVFGPFCSPETRPPHASLWTHVSFAAFFYLPVLHLLYHERPLCFLAFWFLSVL